MPQARARSKNSGKRRQTNSNERSDQMGRTGGTDASKSHQRGAASQGRNSTGERGMQGARSQRTNNQRNASNQPAQQRRGQGYGSRGGQNFDEADSFESGAGRRGRAQSDTAQSSGYRYQEEDFEEGGQNDATARGRGRTNRGQYDQGRRHARGPQYDANQDNDQGYDSRSGGQYDRGYQDEHGGYGPPQGRHNARNQDGWGDRGGPAQFEDEGDWERAGPSNYDGGAFQGGRSYRGRNDVDYYGASQYSRGGGRGDEGPNWNQRYGNVNRVPGGIEDEEFAESRQYQGGSGRGRGRGRRGNGGGFETARGEYAHFNSHRGENYEDSELNDYTDARLGSNARRGRQSGESRSKQGQSGGRKSSGKSASAGRQQRSGRAGR